MELFFVLLGLNVQFIFLLKRELLFNKKSFLIILSFNLVLFFIGNIEFLRPLKIGIASQLIFTLLLLMFKIVFKKNPVDTFWVVDTSLIKDGIFNFLFWVLGILIPVFLFL